MPSSGLALNQVQCRRRANARDPESVRPPARRPSRQKGLLSYAASAERAADRLRRRCRSRPAARRAPWVSCGGHRPKLHPGLLPGWPSRCSQGRPRGAGQGLRPGEVRGQPRRAPPALGEMLAACLPGPVLTTRHHPSLSRQEKTMPAATRSPRSRPHSAPAYYLARPASVWITALHRRPIRAGRLSKGEQP